MLFKKQSESVYLYYPPPSAHALPPLSAELLAELRRYEHLVHDHAATQPACCSSATPVPLLPESLPPSAPAPADPVVSAEAGAEAEAIARHSAICDLESLSALWSSLLVESGLAPLEAVQAFASPLLSLVHVLDSSSTSFPSSLPSARTSVLAHLHRLTTRTARSVKARPAVHCRVLQLHVLLTLVFPSPDEPVLASLFRALDGAAAARERSEGFEFLRLVVAPRFGPGQRARLLRVCAENDYPIPVELAERTQPMEEDDEYDDDDDAEQSAFPIARTLTAASATSSGSRGAVRRARSNGSSASARAVLPQPTLVLPVPPPVPAHHPMSIPSQLQALRQQRLLDMDRAKQSAERARLIVREGLQDAAAPHERLKRTRSTEDDDAEVEKPRVTLKRFSTGVRIHTAMDRQETADSAAQLTAEERAPPLRAHSVVGSDASGRRRLRTKKASGARQLDFGETAGLSGEVAVAAATLSLSSLTSRTSTSSLISPLNCTPPLSSPFRSSPPSATPFSSPRLAVHSLPAAGRVTRRSPRCGVGENEKAFVAETPQSRLPRSAAASAQSSNSRPAARGSATGTVVQSKRSLHSLL